jgi:ABC-type uncharacterized transport system substrate-binding protein
MVDHFKKSLRENGFEENKDVVYRYDGPLGKTNAIGPILTRFVQEKPDLIFTQTTGITIKVREAFPAAEPPIFFVLAL